MTAGVDQDGNGQLQPNEITAATDICNRRHDSGTLSLIKTFWQQRNSAHSVASCFKRASTIA